MLVTMSDKEIHRLPVIQAVCEKRLRRRDAASQLGISERQAQRLINRYRVSGAEGLVSRKRGQPSNRRVTFYFLDYALARDLGFGISMMIFLWATCIITIQDIGRAYPVLT